MPWSEAQQRRLGIERKILEDNFTNRVTWTSPRTPGETKVEVAMNTNNNKQYKLQICLPLDFPNSCPVLLVSSPGNPLKRRDGNIVDASDHSYGVVNNLTQICHFRPNLWTADNTLYQVFMKGRLWIEAFELHHQTGKPIGNYLREMAS